MVIGTTDLYGIGSWKSLEWKKLNGTFRRAFLKIEELPRHLPSNNWIIISEEWNFQRFHLYYPTEKPPRMKEIQSVVEEKLFWKTTEYDIICFWSNVRAIISGKQVPYFWKMNKMTKPAPFRSTYNSHSIRAQIQRIQSLFEEWNQLD